MEKEDKNSASGSSSSFPIPHPEHSAYRVTKIGWYWLGITLLLWCIGLSKNINLLLFLGYCLLVIFLLNVLSAGRQLRSVWARRRLPDMVFAQAPCAVAVEVGNDGSGKVALRIDDAGTQHTLSWPVPWLPRSGTCTLRGEVVLPHRGPYELAPLRVRSGYPFGLFERRRFVGDSTEVLVLPALGWLHRGRLVRRLRGAEFREEEVRRQPRRSLTSQAEFHGLRPFRAGDSPRLIHWRTSARRGELMTREYEDAPGQNLIVVLDTAPERMKQEHDGRTFLPLFEAVVSLTATICHEWCRRRGDRLIVAISGPESVILDDFSGPDHERRVLEALARVQPGPAVDPAALVEQLASRRRFAAALVVLSAGPSALSEVLSRRLHRPATVLDATTLAGCDFYEPPRMKAEG